MDNKKLVVLFVLAAFLVISAVIITVTLMSFSSLEYNEYGFKQKKSTGQIWLDHVYTGGRYFLGPNYNFYVYPADAQTLDLIEIRSFTLDKLEVKVSVHVQYFLRMDELKLLHEAFKDTFRHVIKVDAEAALKGVIPLFTTQELIQNRTEIGKVLHNAVRLHLSGDCCKPGCHKSALEMAMVDTKDNSSLCRVGCIPRSHCKIMDKGLHVEVVNFQLIQFHLPPDLVARYEQVLSLPEEAAKEQLLQESASVRKETQELVKDIREQAIVITSIASAEADLIWEVANEDYNRTIEGATIIGLANSIKSFNISDEEKNKGVEYLRAMINNATVKLNIDLDQLMDDTQ